MTVRTLMARAPSMPVVEGYKLKFEAIHPTLGTAVAGCTVSLIAVYGNPLTGAVDEEAAGTGPFMFVPGPT